LARLENLPRSGPLDAERGQPIDVIDTYVPRSDYPFEVVGLVSLLVGAQALVSIDVPAVPTPARHTFAESGEGEIQTRSSIYINSL
jgi:hypothetical protein